MRAVDEERHDTYTKQKERRMEEGAKEQGNSRLGWRNQWEPDNASRGQNNEFGFYRVMGIEKMFGVICSLLQQILV